MTLLARSYPLKNGPLWRTGIPNFLPTHVGGTRTLELLRLISDDLVAKGTHVLPHAAARGKGVRPARQKLRLRAWGAHKAQFACVDYDLPNDGPLPHLEATDGADPVSLRYWRWPGDVGTPSSTDDGKAAIDDVQDNLATSWRESGLDLHPAPGDGNCFFTYVRLALQCTFELWFV